MSHVREGQRVWAPFPELGGWVRCTVQTAMGNTARVVNPAHEIDTWFVVSALKEGRPLGSAE